MFLYFWTINSWELNEGLHFLFQNKVIDKSPIFFPALLSLIWIFPPFFHRFPPSPGRSLATCRWERTTLTYGLTSSRRATAQTHASTCPSPKRPAEGTWSRWEERSKPGRSAGLSLTETDARSHTLQVRREEAHKQKVKYNVLFFSEMIKLLQISMKPSWKEWFTSRPLRKFIMTIWRMHTRYEWTC